MTATKQLVAAPVRNRISSIDFLRGTVMIIMVLDHVRSYFHEASFDPTDLSQTSPELFFTRWITHYCAPIFVLLAGVSAYLYGKKTSSKRDLSRFLFSRGLWLVLVEITLITFGWQFDRHFETIILQVIWAIGVSMIVLAGVVYLRTNLILMLSLVIIFGHNLLDTISVEGSSIADAGWAILHQFHFIHTPDFSLFIVYPIIPWVGVMMLGYCIGQLYTSDVNPEKRKQILLRSGVVFIVLFGIIRASNGYGDPTPWSEQGSPIFTVLSFFNPCKYPPSLVYILMTIGPALIFLGLAESSKLTHYQPIVTIGRVPFFFYVVHIYLLHGLQLLMMILLPNFTYSDAVGTVLHKPSGFGFSLTAVYFIWGTVLLLLYPLSDWYNRFKNQRRSAWWASYV